MSPVVIPDSAEHERLKRQVIEGARLVAFEMFEELRENNMMQLREALRMLDEYDVLVRA